MVEEPQSIQEPQRKNPNQSRVDRHDAQKRQESSELKEPEGWAKLLQDQER